jgi:hypothetical protein
VGLLRWIRGDDNSTSTAMMSAGLAEIAGIFQPTRHKQTEHVEEASRRRVDVANGSGVDLDNGLAVIRRARTTAATTGATHGATTAATPEHSVD